MNSSAALLGTIDLIMMRLWHTGTLVFTLSFVAHLALGALVNRTIDDTFGDSETGDLPSFYPASGVWKRGQDCGDCYIKSDPARSFRESWTEATVPANTASGIRMQFDGTAIYVFFTLADFRAVGVTTLTECTFTVDGGSPTPYRFASELTPPREERQQLYQQLVFSMTGLSPGSHSLTIETDTGVDQSYVNFDYAIYTHDDDPGGDSGGGTSGDESSGTASTTSTDGSEEGTSVTESTSSLSPTSSPDTVVGLTAGAATRSEQALTASLTQKSSQSPPLSSLTPIEDSNSDEMADGSDSQSSKSESSSPAVGVIVGSVLGGLAFLVLLLILLYFLRLRKKEAQLTPPDALSTEGTVPATFAATVTRRNPMEPEPFLAMSPSPYAPATFEKSSAKLGIIEGGGVIQREYPMDRKERAETQTESVARSADSTVDGSAASSIPVMLPATVTAQQAEIRQARQAEIDSQLQAIQQQMTNLINSRGGQRHMSVGGMHEQIRLMQEQIDILQRNQRSDWAAGLTDEPPPGYHTVFNVPPTPRRAL